MSNISEENKIRKVLRSAIKAYFKNFNESSEQAVRDILEEHRLRMVLRELLVEAAVEDPDADVHDNTGINTLKDMLKNTNVLTTLRGVYKTLTTNEEQRKSFRAHIVKWITDTLAPITINDKAPLDPSDALASLKEDITDGDIDIDVAKTGLNDPDKFIDAKDGSPEQKKDKDDETSDMGEIEGEDATGRNKAERVYPTIEKSVIDYYAELDHEEDQELFFDYLIANIKLYFDKWESEMSTNVEEPTNDEYQSSSQSQQI